MRTPAIDAALVRALSTPRLGRYLADSGGILDAALSLYERNARISEAFHRPLQGLEVCLRNHLNDRLAARYGTHWYRTTAAPLTPATIEKLDKAMNDLQRSRLPINQGSVVAELNFGFWVTLLSRPYARSLWPPTFSGIFHEGGRRMSWQTVHRRMNELRDFRNRVAHHEPIYHLNPAQVHADIIQATAWICPDTAAWILEHSQVPRVLATP
ncbi:MAG: hypothetical protein WCY15_12850 [Phenylobacterium sp.]|uniref:hypothetical protein n=1 Tax=Phenylobacterium sp. TaxID=1871053 RepID=UPI0035693A0D